MHANYVGGRTVTDTRRWLSGAAALALLPAAAASASESGLDVVRLTGNVSRESEELIESLLVAQTVVAGQRIRTHTDGHAVLQLPPLGALAMGPGTAVFVHSVEPPDLPARSGLARLVVENGAVRINTRAQQQLPPADLRINLGTLRIRVFGAEIWVERTSDSEEVCLLGGAIELQSPLGARRLDEPGHCLRTTPAGLKEMDANTAGAMAPRLATTAFPGDPTMLWVAAMATSTGTPMSAATAGTDAQEGLAPVVNASMEAAPDPESGTVAMERVPASPEPDPQPTPGAVPDEVLQPDSAPSPASLPPPASAADGAWTIVLASFPDEAVAQQEAARLHGTGLDTEVMRAGRPDGSATFRVVSGRYATKADVEPDISAIRKRRGLRSAWVVQIR